MAFENHVKKSWLKMVCMCVYMRAEGILTCGVLVMWMMVWVMGDGNDGGEENEWEKEGR